MIQESLGIALRALGERDDLSPSRLSGELQEQSTAGEQALGVLSPQEVVLTAAVDAFRAALTVYSRESDAVAWALTHNNLGCALRARGERDGGVEMLEEAVDSFNFALEVYDRAVMPLRWAIVTSNLGNSLRLLGERSGNPELLNRAVAAQRAALEIRTREKFPMDWAVTQTNLGDALVARGIHAGDAYSLREAVDAYACAIGVFAAASADLWADLARHGRERALGALRERGTS
jgi:tetratricopeptide (TPR) repeat protein